MIHVKKRNGRLETLNVDKINKVISRAAEGLDAVSASEVALDAKLQFFDKIPTTEIDNALILTAATKIEKDPQYSALASRLLQNVLYKEVFGEGVDSDTFDLLYRKAFIKNIKTLVKLERLDKRMLNFDLKKLAASLVIDRDDLFKYPGARILYDRYVIKNEGKRMETFQMFWMRVAMGLSLLEKNPTEYAIEFYNLLSTHSYCSSTPTLFNSGTTHSQMSSCFLNTFEDSIDGIFDGLRQEAQKSKYAGGLGFDVTPFRATGAKIKGTDGESSGIVPWLKLFNDMLIGVNQCFHPTTRVITDGGIKNINTIKVGEHIIAEDGSWRKVKECLSYDYKGKIKRLKFKHSIEDTLVTDQHPVIAFKPKRNKVEYSRFVDNIKLGWFEVGQLQVGDFIAQAIPNSVSKTFELTEDDARFYGLMLGDGHYTLREGNKQEAGISLNLDTDTEVIAFVRQYLAAKEIHTWDTVSGKCLNIRFTPTNLWLTHNHLYSNDKNKRILPEFFDLCEPLRVALIKGLIEANGGIYRENEIHLYNSSKELIEGCAFLLLRSGIPSYSTFISKTTTHLTETPFVTDSWDLRIPSYGIIAEAFNIPVIKKKNWIIKENFLLTKITDISEEDYEGTIHDFKIADVHSYSPVGLVAHNGGKRPGSGCAYLEVWHLDVEEFIDLRKTTGEERRRTHDMNTALWICDLFMEKVEANNDADWYLFCPSYAGHLHELYGNEFNVAYNDLVDKAEAGEIKRFKKLKVKELWKKILTSIFETSHPWLTWKDPCNIRYPNAHEGVVHSSNLCCVTGDQIVPTNEGFLTVKELANKNQLNMQVVGRQQIEMATGIAETLKAQQIYKITTDAGYTHRVTADHPLWVPNVGWVEARDLMPGTLVETQQIEGLWGKEHFPELSFLMGLIAGDGTYTDHSACIDLWDENEDKLKEIEELVTSVINKHDVSVGTNGTLTPKFKSCNTGVSNATKHRLSSAALNKVLISKGFTKENKTDFPVCVLKGNKETVAAYLRGIYYTDGTVQVNKNTTTSSISSTNKKFLETTQIVLANLGIKSSINHLNEAGLRELPDGLGGKKKYQCKDVYRLSITSKKGNKILDEVANIFADRNVEITNVKPIYSVKNQATVVSVEEDGVEDTYCLKVTSNPEHAWTCNGLVTKNTEIMLHTKPSKFDEQGNKVEIGETAVCNLGSINARNHVTVDETGKPVINWDKLKNTVTLAIRALDNVIDLNFYPTEETRNSNLKHRPIGLGLMGFHDLCHQLDIIIDSDAAVKLSKDLQEFISHHAVLASAELAGERGAYSTFKGSTWDNGLLPVDTYGELMSYRNDGIGITTAIHMDYQQQKEAIKKHGMRNSNVMAIAPTATISYIQNCEQSIEPNFAVIFIYENKSGNLKIFNEHFVNDMKKEGLWNIELAEATRAADGDVTLIDIPQKYKDKYKPAHQRDMFKLIEVAAARQIHIDQGQSFNIYNDQVGLKHMQNIALAMWKKGLKTSYYWRNQAASKVEKVTTGHNPAIQDNSVFNTQTVQSSACSLEARLAGCESCS